MKEFKIYIKGLSFLDETMVVNSQRKTGFLGLLFSLENCLKLYKLLTKNYPMKFLLTYKISQDHIETMFSAIRSRGGYNDNPTCRQFVAAFKRVLVHNEISGSLYGNCIALDNTTHLTGKKFDDIQCKEPLTFSFSWCPTRSVIDHDYFDNYIHLSKFVDCVSSYISGFVAKKVAIKTDCENCKSSLTTTHTDILTQIKNRGYLTKASNDVVLICNATEKMLRQYPNQIYKRNSQQFYIAKVKSQLYKSCKIFTNLDCGNDAWFENDHKNNLVNKIILKYLDIRMYHEFNLRNIDHIKTRSKLTKQIHFNHD